MTEKRYTFTDDNGPLAVDEDLYLMMTEPGLSILKEEIQKEIDKEIIEHLLKLYNEYDIFRS